MSNPGDKSDQVTDAPEVTVAPRKLAAPWSPEDVKLLGTMPDSEVARLLDRAPSAIRHKRHKPRIPAYQSSFHNWTPEEEQVLGTMSDEEVVARTGHPLSGVIQRRQKLHRPLPRPWHQPWTSPKDDFAPAMEK